LSAKIEIVNTLSIEDASKIIGIDEKSLLKMAKNGEIIAIECGGTNDPTFYEIPEPEVLKMAEKIKREARKVALFAEENDATVEGRKVINLSIPSLESPMIIAYVNDLAKCTVKELVEAACNHYFINPDDLKGLKCDHSLKLALKDLRFDRTALENGVYFIASITFKGKEETAKKNEEASKEPQISIQEDIDVPDRVSALYYDFKDKAEKLEVVISAFDAEYVDFDDVATIIDELKRISDEIKSKISSVKTE